MEKIEKYIAVQNNICSACHRSNIKTFNCVSCEFDFCKPCLSHSCAPGNQTLYETTRAMTYAHVIDGVPDEALADCAEHPGEKLQLFCRNEGVVCCSTCEKLRHGPCHVEFLQTVIEETTEDLRALNDNVQHMHDCIEAIKQRKQARRENIKRSKTKAIDAINEYRKIMNDKLDAIQKSSIEDVDEFAAMEDSVLQQHLDMLDATGDDLTALENEVKGAEDLNTVALHELKKSQEWFTDKYKVLKQIENDQSENYDSLVYDINFDIDKASANPGFLGRCVQGKQ